MPSLFPFPSGAAPPVGRGGASFTAFPPLRSHIVDLHSFLTDALDLVLDWDLPDDVCPLAVTTQASHMAGLQSDEVGGTAAH